MTLVFTFIIMVCRFHKTSFLFVDFVGTFIKITNESRVQQHSFVIYFPNYFEQKGFDGS